MTPHVICPTCQGLAKRMPVLSAISFADYFQCNECKTVSHTQKDAAGPAIVFGANVSSQRH